jgi:RNA polymerase sigma-70 factor (ECF subfamily)
MDIYLRYGPALMRKCIRMLGSVPDAEDIVQGLFVDLLKQQRRAVDLAYLYRATTNRCLNHIRNARKRATLLSRHGDTLTPVGLTRLDERMIGVEQLVALVDQLDEKSREILVYRYFDDMSQEEIAELTGYSRKTVGTKLQKIRERVETMMETRTDDDPGNRGGGAP